MDIVLGILIEYGPFIGLPLVINMVMLALKKSFPALFTSTIGMRFVHFIPLVLGVVGGLLLPLDTWQDKILVGGSLGGLSHYIYKLVTRTLAKGTDLESVASRKTLAPKEE